MPLSSDTNVGLAEPVRPDNPATQTAQDQDGLRGTAGQPLENAVGELLSEALDGVVDSADPVAGLESAMQAVAQEFSRRSDAEWHSESATTPREIETAIETLVNVALDADDPVAALEEGADALAEALAARDAAAEERLLLASEQQAELQGAYQHARLHRVIELMDVGYDLDQAVAITNTNEAQIRARAVAAGRDPMELIYQYAVLNGYRGELGRPTPEAPDRPMPAAPRSTGQESSTMEALARLSDEAFAEATSGDFWERMMRR